MNNGWGGGLYAEPVGGIPGLEFETWDPFGFTDNELGQECGMAKEEWLYSGKFGAPEWRTADSSRHAGTGRLRSHGTPGQAE